ncbi:phenylalanine--tRNA ligase subunit beta [Patescibacteria group bacterium]|nr:phenylalanine--tRNA ligase subunit beta [Patescibacteria group bacterium]
MLFSYNWLKEFLPDLKKTPQEVAQFLNQCVANVEKIRNLKEEIDSRVIVGQILEIKKHPQADKLNLVKVDLGNKTTTVVCGASNIKEGQRVPLAQEGTELPSGDIIKKVKIRGIESRGMLCSARELGLGSDHQGIFILPSDAPLGQILVKALGFNDYLLEIENKSITHRSDLFNHRGLAREIRAGAGKNLRFQNLKTVPLDTCAGPLKLDLKNKAPDLCSRYLAVILDNIRIEPSPLVMQNRLRNLGIQPINNVVDIMNYVMLESGQPLHAFDFDKISEDKKQAQIVIRRAQSQEKMVALHQEEHVLEKEDLVIANSKTPLALAGLIGGKDSGIDSNTQRIVIESANFNPINLRRTSWRLGLRTEAVLRFEKGLPLIFTESGLGRSLYLLQKMLGARVASSVYNFSEKSANKKVLPSLLFDIEKLEKFVGQKIPSSQITRILEKLDCQVTERKKGKLLQVQLPLHRPDLLAFEDLAEEVIRLYGLEKIKPQPIKAFLEPTLLSPELKLRKKVSQVLRACGFDEVYNYAFTDQPGKVKVINPLNSNQGYLKKSLQADLIKNAEQNLANFQQFKIFEIGKIFDPQEKIKIGGLICAPEKDIFQEAKGVLELLWEELGIDKQKFDYQEKGIYLGGKKRGELRLVSDQFAVFEIDFAFLIKEQNLVKKYSLISPYPPVKRDLAFLIDQKYSWAEIFREIKTISPLIKAVELFDVFDLSDHQKKIEGQKEKRSLAFHLIYQSKEKTLESKEVEKVQKIIINKLKQKFKAELRNF